MFGLGHKGIFSDAKRIKSLCVVFIGSLIYFCTRRKMTRKQSIKSLVKLADKLYQVKLIAKYPKSIISGLPTEVIHHMIPKSQSNNLRYDEDNGIPLTHGEHCRHHKSGDPSIVAKILKTKGQAWFDKLTLKRRIICKFNKGYLQSIIEKYEDTRLR